MWERTNGTQPCPHLPRCLYHGHQDAYPGGYRDRFQWIRRELLQSTLLETGGSGGGCSTLLGIRALGASLRTPACLQCGTSEHVEQSRGGERSPGSSHGLPAQGGSPCLAGAIGMTPGKILITVASKVPPVTAVAGPAQEVQIIGVAGILVTPWGAGSPDSTAVPRQTQAEPLPGTQPATAKRGLGRSG